MTVPYPFMIFGLAAGYSVFVIFGYSCDGSRTFSYGNSLVEKFSPLTDVLAGIAPLVEHYSRKMEATGFPCNIDLMRHVYTINFMILILSFLVSLTFVHQFSKTLEEHIESMVSSDRKKEQKLNKMINMALIMVAMCTYLYFVSSLRTPAADMLSNRIYDNKWYLLFDSTLISGYGFFLISATSYVLLKFRRKGWIGREKRGE